MAIYRAHSGFHLKVFNQAQKENLTKSMITVPYPWIGDPEIWTHHRSLRAPIGIGTHQA